MARVPPSAAAGTAGPGAPAATCGRPGPPRAAQLLRAPGLVGARRTPGFPQEGDITALLRAGNAAPSEAGGLGRGGEPGAGARRTQLTLNAIVYRYFQEPNNEKTNNGIHYKLQLLYSNGKWLLPPAARARPARSRFPRWLKDIKILRLK